MWNGSRARVAQCQHLWKPEGRYEFYRCFAVLGVWGSGGEHLTARIPHYGAWKPLAEGTRVGTQRPCDGDNRILPIISFSPSFADNLLPWSLNTFCYLIANCVFILYGSFPLSALLHSFWLLRSLSLSPDLVLFSSFFLQVQCQAAKREEQESLKEAWSWKLSTFPSTWGSRSRRLAIEIAWKDIQTWRLWKLAVENS